MKLFFLCLFSIFLFVKPVYAANSSIAEAEGTACMGDDKSRKQTEQAAMNEAKKKAIEFVSTHVTSETRIQNFELAKDLLSSYANAEVKIIKELNKKWFKDISLGDCYKIKIRAEVIPDNKTAASIPSTEDIKHLYELQERCNQAANEYFKNYRHDYELMNYGNHYNIKLNKCFILIIGIGEAGGLKMKQKDLNDVNENALYGWFLGSNVSTDVTCKILGQTCHSEAEFDALIKPYMTE